MTVEDALELRNEHPLMMYAKVSPGATAWSARWRSLIALAHATQSSCGFCIRATELLEDVVSDDASVRRTDLDAGGKLGADVQAAIREKYGLATVPAVFVGGQLIGGHDDVSAALRDGSLEEKLQAAGVELRE